MRLIPAFHQPAVQKRLTGHRFPCFRHSQRIIWSRKRSISKHLAYGHIGIEVHLPIMIVVAVRPYGEHRTERIEGEDSHVGSGRLANIRDGSQAVFKTGYRKLRIRRSGNLSCQFDTAISVRGVVLNGVGEDFVVADEGPYVVGCVEARHKEPDFMNGSGDSPCGNEIAYFERTQNKQESAGREVG